MVEGALILTPTFVGVIVGVVPTEVPTEVQVVILLGKFRKL